MCYWPDSHPLLTGYCPISQLLLTCDLLLTRSSSVSDCCGNSGCKLWTWLRWLKWRLSVSGQVTPTQQHLIHAAPALMRHFYQGLYKTPGRSLAGHGHTRHQPSWLEVSQMEDVTLDTRESPDSFVPSVLLAPPPTTGTPSKLCSHQEVRTKMAGWLGGWTSALKQALNLRE